MISSSEDSLRVRPITLLTGRKLPGVFDDAVARLEHALDLAALGALGQPAIRNGHVENSHDFSRSERNP